jgi:hypothetical protein
VTLLQRKEGRNRNYRHLLSVEKKFLSSSAEADCGATIFILL